MVPLRNLLPGNKPPAVPQLPGALPAGMRVGPWQVVRPLGQGGSGAVYLVKRWGRYYALKMATRPGDKRLQREGRLLRRVKHPGLVRLHGQGWWLGRKKGFPYLVMEYVEGLPLYTWARGTNPTPRQIALLLAQAAEALEAVHQERSLHRDVKGANTLVRPGGQQLVLVDLGAGDYEGATSLTSQVLPPVTELYLSPEAMQFAQRHATDSQAHYKARPSDDLYALGVMAHRVLTDDYPFATHMPRDLRWAVVQSAPAPDARAINPRVPAALAAIVQRLLAKRPEQRYASAQEAAEALRKAAAEGGPEWGEPLFEWYTEPGPASRTTLVGAPAGPVAPDQELALSLASADHREWQQWMRQRRMVGRRSPTVAQVEEADPAPARPPAPDSAWRWWTAGALLMLALSAGAAVLTWLSGPGTSEPTPSGQWAFPTQEVGVPGQEVARPGLAPDAGTGAAPSEASTPAPVAPAMPPPEDTRVNPPPQPATARSSKPQPSKSSAPGHTLTKVLPLCLGMACAHSAQELQPVPLTEPCPPGAVDTMRELGIKVGERSHPGAILFAPLPPTYITVKEGWITGILSDDFGNLPRDTEISGRLFLGDRIYVRFTVARMPGDRTVPVCMELWGFIHGRGEERSTADTPGNVKLVSVSALRAVDVFK
jgi:serine/threonine protein kinase